MLPFSKLSTTNYNKSDVNSMFYKIKEKKREKGYEFNYLIHTCLKEDNPKFYEKNFKPKI